MQFYKVNNWIIFLLITVNLFIVTKNEEHILEELQNFIQNEEIKKENLNLIQRLINHFLNNEKLERIILNQEEINFIKDDEELEERAKEKNKIETDDYIPSK